MKFRLTLVVFIFFKHNSFTQKLLQLFDIDDDSLLHVTPLATLPSDDHHRALQQRKRTTEIITQKIEVIYSCCSNYKLETINR